MPHATVPVPLPEGEFDCDVEFNLYKTGSIEVTKVSKPVGNMSYADVQVSQETLDFIESWLYDNWSDY